MGVTIRRKFHADSCDWMRDTGPCNCGADFWLFIRHGGERVSQKVGPDRDVAEDARRDILRDIRNKKFDIAAMKAARAPEKPKTPTVKEYWETTFQPVYIDSAVAKSTRAKYVQNFTTHILPALGSLPIDAVTQDRMETFIALLVKKAPHVRKSDGATDSESERVTLAKATIETIVSNLRKFFNHARRRKLIADNPACGLSGLYSQARANYEAIEPLIRDEVPLFLSSIRQRKESRQHYPLFFTAIHTGLRQGELAGLQTGDVDLNGKYVSVQRSIDRVHRKIQPTKSKKIRRVDLSDELIAVLKDHIRQQKEYWFRQGKPQPVWLFPNEEGSWQDMMNLSQRHFHRCLEKAGLHQRRFHDLRHTFASLLLTNGAPIAYVSEQMGHASIQLTVKLYGHLQPGANRHWMNSLPGEATTPSTTTKTAAD